MPNEQNIIGLAWDIPAFDESTQKVIDKMLQVLDLGKQIGNTAIKPGPVGGYTELKAQVDQTNALADAQAKLITQQKAAESSTKAHTDAAQKLTREQKLQQTVTESATGSYKQLDAQLKLLMVQYKSLSEAERNSASGRQLQTDILEKNAQLKIFDADLGNYQRNVGNYNSSLGRLSKGLKGLGGLGILLSKALGIDPEVADGIREAGRAVRELQHARELEEIGLKGEAELYEQSKNKIEAFAATTEGAVVAENELTVAGAKNIVTTEAQTVAQEELTVATVATSAATSFLVNVLKFSGIAIVVAAIAYLVYKLYESGKAAEEAARKQKEYNQALHQSAGEYENAVTLVNKLTEEIKLAKEGFISKKETLEEYNSTIGKTTGQVKDLDEAEQALVKNGQAYITMMLYKTAANYALQASAKKAYEAEETSRKAIEEFSSITDVTSKGVGVATYGYNASGAEANAKQLKRANEDAGKEQQKRKDASIKLSKEESKEQLEIAQDFFKKAGEISKNFKFDFYGGKDTKKEKKEHKDSSDLLNEALRDDLRQIKETAKLKSDAILDGDKKAYQNNASSFADRLAALRKFNADSLLSIGQQQKDSDDIAKQKQTINLDKAKEIVDVKLRAKTIRAINKDYQDTIIKDQSEADKKKSDLDFIYSAEAKKIAKETYDYIKEQGISAYKAIEKSISDSQKDSKDQNEIDKNNKLAQLDKDFHSGKIKNVADYNRQKQNIEDAHTIKDLRADEERINQQKIAFGDSLDLQRQYSDDEDKIRELRIQKELEGKQKIHDAEIDIAKSAQQVIIGLTDAKYQHEIDAIQKVIDLNNQRKDQEIASINASTLSNQEKAAQLIILDKTVAANNHKLAVEQNEIKVKQAKFDRDVAILEITENAAVAIIGALKIPIYGEAEAIAIGAMAAAQIALLLAKPLPTVPAYAKGTDNHPGGPAIVGEAGRELVQAGGRSFIADRPMLLNDLAKGAKVIPLTSDDIMTGMSGGAAMAMSQRYSQVQVAEQQNREVVEAIRETGRATVQAMKKQRGSSTTVIVNGDWNAYVRKYVRE